jgi:nitroreductase
VTECLRLAVQAPTGGNRQGWRWLVVTDPERRARVAEIYRAAALEPFTAALAAAPDEATRRAYQSALWLADVLPQVPVLVLPCVVGRVDPPTTNGYASLFGSIIPAVWSFQLALRSRGLGSTYTTVHLRREAEMAALLGIPEGVTQAALLPVAYTKGTEFRPAARRPVEEVTYIDGWPG